MKHAISWFEIPVTNMERAITFYRTILGTDFQRMDVEGMPYAAFATEPEGITGALAQGEGFVPSTQGTVVYLAVEDVNEPAAKVEAAGGQVLVPKTAIGGDMGFFALVRDTEGNKVGLYSSH